MDYRRIELTIIILIIIGAFGLVASVATGNIELRFTGKAVSSDIEYSDLMSISKDTLDILNTRYISSNREFSGCLQLKPIYSYSDDKSRLDTQFIITGIDNISESGGENYAKHGYCQNALIHSHPEKNCFFSLSDLYAIKDRFNHGEILSVIICGENHLIFITRNDLKERRIKI